MQAGDLDQVLQHRVPGVHGRAGRGVYRARDDDPDAGEGAQEEVPVAGRLRAQAGQARRAGPRGAETGMDTKSNFHLTVSLDYFVGIDFEHENHKFESYRRFQKRPVGERRKKKKQQQQRRREEESEEILIAANFDAESAELALER